jgi:hypothetical protein
VVFLPSYSTLLLIERALSSLEAAFSTSATFAAFSNNNVEAPLWSGAANLYPDNATITASLAEIMQCIAAPEAASQCSLPIE